MQKILLLLFFFLLNGCALNSPFLAGEVDKVYVVKHDSYIKHNRAYFTRTDLKPIRNGNKYLYLYRAKDNNLAILLHRKDKYHLYSLSHPDKKEIIFKTRHKTKDRTVLKNLRRKGYRTISPATVGYISHVSMQRYKGVKTLLVEVEDYSRLQNMYKKAIRTYNAKDIKHIKTKLPKELIYSYYKQYHKRAKTQRQLAQLQIIARKLQLNSVGTAAQTTKKDLKKSTEEIIVEETVEEDIIEEDIIEEKVPEKVTVNKVIKKPKEVTKPYSYYLKSASYAELNTYLSKSETRGDLTYNQYNQLKEKQKEEKLLVDGSLEEVIAAYKKNKDPRYKARSLQLMKKVHESK